MVQVNKSLVFIVGGPPGRKEEITSNLQSLYSFEAFDQESTLLVRLFSTVPTAIIIDEFLPPMGGVGLIAKIRKVKAVEAVPIIFTADVKHREVIAEATSYDYVTLIEGQFTRSAFIHALSRGVNASIEGAWERMEPTQRAALQQTLSSFNLIADLVHAGEPIPYDQVRDSCLPLVQAVENNNFKSILAGVSNHDNYTYVHSLRVATFLSLFGSVLGIKGDDLTTLCVGGLLHDVGKMQIPHDVLNKPGKLTDEEYEVMKSHVCCTVGFLEKTSELPRGVMVVAGQHHEKLDGTGYPHGVAGTKLNDLARMATIIDIFSAITDRRVYKDAIEPEQALKIMSNLKGQLDSSFLSLFREMLLDGATT